MRIERFLAPPGAEPGGFFARPALALGFRPFFLLAGAFAALWLPLWLLLWFGGLTLPHAGHGMGWHGHEMIFGFAVAVIAGFLLTAVRTWTRQPTPSGGSLAALAALWLLGRLAMLFGGALPSALVVAVDVAFLPAVAVAVAIPIVRARNRRNYAIPLLLLLFTSLNVAFHLGDAAVSRAASFAAVDLLVVFLVFIGGRVIPFFTRNALPDAGVVSRRWLDWTALVTVLALIPLRFFPTLHTVTAVVALVAGAANLARLAGWGGWATRGRPILWVLHLGYLWVAVGLLFSGAGPWIPALGDVALHALTVGALGTLIIGMISRVSLGHTGRPLLVGRATVAAYVLVLVAALARVALPLVSLELYAASLIISGSAWSLAFALFTVSYWSILTTPRPDGAPG